MATTASVVARPGRGASARRGADGLDLGAPGGEVTLPARGGDGRERYRPRATPPEERTATSSDLGGQRRPDGVDDDERPDRHPDSSTAEAVPTPPRRPPARAPRCPPRPTPAPPARPAAAWPWPRRRTRVVAPDPGPPRSKTMADGTIGTRSSGAWPDRPAAARRPDGVGDPVGGGQPESAAAGQHDGVARRPRSRVEGSVSRVPGPPPRTSTPPTVPRRRQHDADAGQPARLVAVAWPTRTPSTSVIALWVPGRTPPAWPMPAPRAAGPHRHGGAGCVSG